MPVSAAVDGAVKDELRLICSDAPDDSITFQPGARDVEVAFCRKTGLAWTSRSSFAMPRREAKKLLTSLLRKNCRDTELVYSHATGATKVSIQVSRQGDEFLIETLGRLFGSDPPALYLQPDLAEIEAFLGLLNERPLNYEAPGSRERPAFGL